MKELKIFVLVLIGFLLGLTVAIKILTPTLPSFLAQTFELAGSAPGNPSVALPHWRLETGIVWKVWLGAVIILSIAIILSKKRKGGLR